MKIAISDDFEQRVANNLWEVYLLLEIIPLSTKAYEKDEVTKWKKYTSYLQSQSLN